MTQGTSYFYYVRAIKSNGIKGEFSDGVSTSTTVPPPPPPQVIEHVGSHTCALVERNAESGTGYVTCWGKNDFGQLGDGTRTNRNRAVFPTSNINGNIVSIAVGPHHACAVQKQGNRRSNPIYCWGRNESGQLGDGTTTDRSRPRKVQNRYGDFYYHYPTRILDLGIGSYATEVQ